MKNIAISDAKRDSISGEQPRLMVVKIEKAFSKVVRQGAFIESVAKLPMDEACFTRQTDRQRKPVRFSHCPYARVTGGERRF